ncbi:SDR family NAD(P)-dependent oxidoreductase [Agrobacterium tumefaciens]|uniref:SDR family oxidoreductase n=1 Tax=Agrobacterium tumefaciens TaxID=358 RepID=A0AA44F3F2_AGRTU|nr:SDR family oxidoreductase [Agrobacterium tumefaciens]NSL21736.1 SDR family oxidoreductase [Agrobacterium tumefaciens]NTC16612.1 SDR family oxidoreductase [Agrobacterium tumefaciens]NTC28068.1 SDR family oxidoreductase [Agrobacterium tumefaciens]NTC58240.1 SDR family oxidoreductase [Agrobacterium tumefaciens]NTC60230.1 SDR family oxidoreductase [Agrobacterium tumefaciens]
MHIDLTGKTALVTGSTEGIGFAIANGLHNAGATVVINGRSPEKVDAAVSRLGGRAQGRACDLSTAQGCDALVSEVPDIDILVNNVGIFQPADFFDASDEVWEKHWQINVMSGVRLSRAYAKAMAARNWGRIIFISSESAFNIPIEMVHYGVTKTSDIAVSRGLAKRIAGTGVTVNAVLPGPTLSEGMVSMLKDQASNGESVEEAGKAFVMSHRPSSILQRPATVEEVANMVVYVASNQASATTGAALRVDGGVVDFIV